MKTTTFFTTTVYVLCKIVEVKAWFFYIFTKLCAVRATNQKLNQEIDELKLNLYSRQLYDIL